MPSKTISKIPPPPSYWHERKRPEGSNSRKRRFRIVWEGRIDLGWALELFPIANEWRFDFITHTPNGWAKRRTDLTFSPALPLEDIQQACLAHYILMRSIEP